MGMLAGATGQPEEAMALVIRSLQIKPESVVGINFLGGLLKDQGRYEDAIEIYVGGIEIDPKNHELLNSLGVALEAAGRFEEAVGIFQQSLVLMPKLFSTYNNLGNSLRKLRRLGEAEENYRTAFSLNPQSPIVLSNLAITLRDKGQYAEAEEMYRKALKQHPKHEPAYTGLGTLYRLMGRNIEAIEAYRNALEAEPSSVTALNNLGNALRDTGLYSEATVCFNQALKFKPDYALAHSNLGAVYTMLGRSEESIPCFRKALELNPYIESAMNNLLFALNYLAKGTPEEIYAEHSQFETVFGAKYRSHIRPHLNDRTPNRRLKVGYVSGDLRNHAVTRFLEPILEWHDKSQVELYAYSNSLTMDEVSVRLKPRFDHWRCVVSLTDDELAELIRSEGIDILVDLSGHTALNRLLVFARKPAPVQFTMIGYMQTTGLKAIDYRITDNALDDPEQDTQRFSSEKLVHFKWGAAPFQPPDDAPEVNELPALKNGYITYASFNNLAKVTTSVYEAWAKVLHAVPTSRMLLVGGRDVILEEFAKFGIDEARLEILPRQSLREYFNLHLRVDFILDAFPYTGGTTNLIALWLGIPYVTIIGDSPVSRTGAAILTLVPYLQELACANTDRYVGKAIEIASDFEKLAQWRREMRPILDERLKVNAKNFTEELEEAYRTGWNVWCASAADLTLEKN